MSIILVDPVRTNKKMIEEMSERNIDFNIFYTKSYGFFDKLSQDMAVKHNITFTSSEDDLVLDDSTLFIPCTEEAVSWVDGKLGGVDRNDRSYLETTTSFPAVVKPKDSFGGGDDVHLVESQTELDNLNLDLDQYIMQPKFNGIEYEMDLVRKGDKTYCIGLFEIELDPLLFPLRKELRLIDDLDTQTTIFNFLKNKLDDLNFGDGAYNIEMIKDGNDINLLEINCRFHGHAATPWYTQGTGRSHYSAFLDVFIDNKTIPEMYTVNKHIRKVVINLPHKISHKNLLKEFPDSLDSIVEFTIHPSPYNQVVSVTSDSVAYGPTTNVLTAYGYFMLVDNGSLTSDLTDISNWYNTIKDMPNEP